jgi:uncharacterized protein
MRFRLFVFFLSVAFLLGSCLTYYQKNAEFQSKFESGQLVEAQKMLDEMKEKKLRKTLVIYKLNQGALNSLLGNYTKSNQFFEEAYIMGEDYQRNYANEAASFMLNPNMVVYNPEMHESILIHYYKALNYLKLEMPDEALVECKRINIKTQQFNDLYKSERKMKDDAFAHNLMGIVYQANRDYNNAFIAYRNAYNIYQKEYKEFFGVSAPEQLKRDLLNAAYKTGFMDEVAFYEKEMGLKYKPTIDAGKGEAVLFWNDGLGPVKDQNAIDFVLVRGQGGALIFRNDELGISIPFFISDSEYQSSGFGDLNVFRVAFPKYVERPLVFTSAILSVNNQSVPLGLGMDINQVAFKSLRDRMLAEMAKSLLRFAAKKALEYQVRKENQNLGAVVGLLGALTENADTRNWQTLPHSVYYTRVSLPEGQHEAKLNMQGERSNSVSLQLAVKTGRTSFYTYNTLDYLRTY